jgi:hypothetical protein
MFHPRGMAARRAAGTPETSGKTALMRRKEVCAKLH